MPPREQNHLKEIITTLADNEVEFIICGGVALALHGVERMTMDIDNHRIKAISKERLLEMKRAVSPLREKDIFDIHELEKIIKNGS